MIDIENNNIIILTQGNSALIDITPIDVDTGEPIVLEDGDKVLFTIKTQGGISMLQKTLTKDDYTDVDDKSLNCAIHPTDTINWGTGDYLYDCLLITDSGEAITFISSIIRLLKALGKVTDVGDSNE